MAALACVALVAPACSSDATDSGGNASSADALAEIGAGFGLETYDRLASATGDLAEAISSVCEQPTDQSYAVAQDFYADARIALSAADAIWIGPAEEERSRSTIDPAIVEEDIEEAIGSIPAEELDAEYVSTKVGVTKRGLRTVEYLLFDAPVEPGEGRPTPSFIEPQRCNYAKAVAGSVANESEMLLGRWKTGDDIRKPYSEALGDADDAEMRTSDLINAHIALLRDLADTQLSPALQRSGDPENADTSSIVEGGAEMGTDTMLTRVQALRDVLVGPQGDEHFAGQLGDELAADVLADTEAVVDAGAVIDGSLRAAASEDPDRVGELYEAIEGLEATLSTQVTEALGVTTGFTGGDGDGGS